MAAADLAGDRLRLWAAAGSNVAGVDSGLRGARAQATGRGAGQASGGQRANTGPIVGAPTSGRAGPFADAAGHVAAPSDSDSGQRVGGKQAGVAGSRYGGPLWGQRSRGICLDARRSRLRHDLGGSAGDLGPGPGGNAGRLAKYRSLLAFCAAGTGQRQRRGVLESPRDEVAPTAAPTRVFDAKAAPEEGSER